MRTQQGQRRKRRQRLRQRRQRQQRKNPTRTSHIKGCRTPEQLGDLIETHDFDYIHVVATLGSLTRMQQGLSSLTLTKLTALVRTNMGRMKARELANTLPYRMRPTRNVVLMLVGCGADAIAFEK